MHRKTTFANIHVKNMTHVTELELNTRAFAPPFVRIPFIPVGRTKECQECAKIFLQVGSSAVRFKNVPLTTESKISLRSRSVLARNNKIWNICANTKSTGLKVCRVDVLQELHILIIESLSSRRF